MISHVQSLSCRNNSAEHLGQVFNSIAAGFVQHLPEPLIKLIHVENDVPLSFGGKYVYVGWINWLKMWLHLMASLMRSFQDTVLF